MVQGLFHISNPLVIIAAIFNFVSSILEKNNTILGLLGERCLPKYSMCTLRNFTAHFLNTEVQGMMFLGELSHHVNHEGWQWL